MAPTNTLQDVKDSEDSENNCGNQRSESPKTPVRGRGAWIPTPKPLLPSQVVALRLEAPKEIEIMRFGVPCFGRNSGGEESDEEEGGEGGFCPGEPKRTAEAPVEKELSGVSIETRTQKEVLLVEKDTPRLDETRDLGHLKNAEELEGVEGPIYPEEPKEAQKPERPERQTEPNAEEEMRKVEKNVVKKIRPKLEQVSEHKPHGIYRSPTTERKPFHMKKQSELPARIQTLTIRVRELSDGPRSPTIASKLKWVNQPSSPTTLEKKRQTTLQSTQSRSGSVISPSRRQSTPTPTLRAPGTVRSQTLTRRLLSPPPESSLRRPSSAPGLKHEATPSLRRGSSSGRSIPEPLIPVIPQEHILRLANLVGYDPGRAVEDMFPRLSSEVAPKPEVWNNRMRKEELCPGCRRCAVKFEFVCGDMICGGCYDRLLKESGKRNVRCIACQVIVG